MSEGPVDDLLNLTDDSTIHPEIRGARAKALLGNPVFIDALVAYRNDLTRTWARSDPGEAEAREVCYHQLRALGEVERKLRGYVADARSEQIKREKAG